MQSSNVPAKTKTIEKSRKDRRMMRKKIVEQEQEENQQEDQQEDSEDDDVDDSEEETESEVTNPQQSISSVVASSQNFTESSSTECNQISSVLSSEMAVQEPTNSDSKSSDKQNNPPSFFIGQDQIEQQPEAKQSSSSSSGSSGSSSDEDLEIGDDDIMGFVDGDYEDDEFYDIDDSDEDDQFDIQTEIIMQSQKLRSSIEEAKIKAMMQKSLPNPFGAQNIISEMYKMNWYNEVNHRYLTNLMQHQSKQPSSKRLYFDDVIIVKTFMKQQNPNDVHIKMQRFQGLNMNEKNPTQRLLAQQRLWHQLKNNPNAHAMFDQHIKQTIKIQQSSNQNKFPLNLGPINRNPHDQSKKPMLLRSQLRPVQKQAEVKPISIAQALQSRRIEIISNNQTSKTNQGQLSTVLEGGTQNTGVDEPKADIVQSVNTMQQENKAIDRSDQIENKQSQVPRIQAQRGQFIDQECNKVDVVCEPFKQNIVDKILVDS